MSDQRITDALQRHLDALIPAHRALQCSVCESTAWKSGSMVAMNAVEALPPVGPGVPQVRKLDSFVVFIPLVCARCGHVEMFVRPDVVEAVGHGPK